MDNSSLQALKALNQVLQNILTAFPLELSVFLLSILEEVIVPIPAPLILLSAGGLVLERGGGIISLVLLAILASFGKTLGTWVIYILARKAEDFIFSKFGKVMGVSRKQVDSIGKLFTGTWRDILLLFVLRAVPVIPTPHVSAFCGIINFNLRTFLFVSFLGLTVRQFIFLYIGYQGKEAYEAFNKGYGSIESFVGFILMIIISGGLIYWIVDNKAKNKNKN